MRSEVCDRKCVDISHWWEAYCAIFCKLCIVTFKDSSNFKNHKDNIHKPFPDEMAALESLDGQRFKFKCKFCSENLMNLHVLNYHVLNAHREERKTQDWICQYCNFAIKPAKDRWVPDNTICIAKSKCLLFWLCSSDQIHNCTFQVDEDQEPPTKPAQDWTKRQRQPQQSAGSGRFLIKILQITFKPIFHFKF